jgi:lipopolysaccharide transport system permease protein
VIGVPSASSSGRPGAAAALALSWRIFRRTIGAKYRRSFLGYFWMVAPALLITGGVVLASESGVVDPGPSPLPRALSVFLGTLLWQVFAEAVEVPTQAFEGARSYLTRVHFSRAAVVLAQLHESLLTTAVRLLAATALLAVEGCWSAGVALLPLLFLAAVLLGVGLGCFLLPVCTLFADVQQVLKIVLGYGLFLTPAMYQPQTGWFAAIVAANPVSPLIVAAREAAAGAAIGQPWAVLAVGVAGAAATALGFALVRAVAPILIERMLLGGR